MNIWYGYVYKTTNLLNGKIYIGRRKGTFNRAYHGSGMILKRALALHGSHAFITEVLTYAATYAELCEMERHHIHAYRESFLPSMLYNISDGGEGGHTGCVASQETRTKQSLARRGEKNGMHGVHLFGDKNPMWDKKHSLAARRLIADALSKNRGKDHGNFGLRRSPETRNKISAAKKGIPNLKLRGRKISDEQRAILSRAASQRTGERNSFFGRHHSPETITKIRAAKARGV